MRPSVITFLGLLLLCSSTSQCQVAATGAATAVHEKRGEWETLKLVNPGPTPNDARNFGSAFPIGNGRLGAKVFGWPAAEAIPLNDTTLWSGPGLSILKIRNTGLRCGYASALAKGTM